MTCVLHYVEVGRSELGNKIVVEVVVVVVLTRTLVDDSLVIVLG